MHDAHVEARKRERDTVIRQETKSPGRSGHTSAAPEMFFGEERSGSVG